MKSQPSSKSSREWNLGKSYQPPRPPEGDNKADRKKSARPASSDNFKEAPKVEESPFLANRPAAANAGGRSVKTDSMKALADLARSGADPGQPLAPSASTASFSGPARPVPPPRSLREYLNHPVTLVVVGLIFSILLIGFILASLQPANITGKRMAENVSAHRAMSAFILSGGRSNGTEAVEALFGEIPEPGPPEHARLMVATGQILRQAAEFRRLAGGGSAALSRNYTAVPPAVAMAPLPDAGDDAEMRLNQQAVHDDVQARSLEIGRSLIQRSIQEEVTPDQLEALGKRLIAEGGAILESEPAPGTENGLLPSEVVPGMLAALFEPAFVDILQSVRTRYFVSGT